MGTTKEAPLVYRVEDWLVSQGYETRLELQWRPLARTDLVGRKDGRYIAVEVKTRGWKKALEQAARQGKAFDHVYIAAKYAGVTPSLRTVLEDSCIWTNWVGVLGITGDGIEVLRPARPKPGRRSELHCAIVAIQFLTSSRRDQVPFSPHSRGLTRPGPAVSV